MFVITFDWSALARWKWTFDGLTIDRDGVEIQPVFQIAWLCLLFGTDPDLVGGAGSLLIQEGR